jgi:adenosine deaminase
VRLDEISDFFQLFPAIYALTSTPEALAKATQAVLSSFLDPQLPPQPKILNSHHHVSTKPLSGTNTGVVPTLPAAAQCTYLELRTTPRQTPQMSREVYLRTVLSTISASNYTTSQVSIIASLDRRMSREDVGEI